jgi:hypothetical protein
MATTYEAEPAPERFRQRLRLPAMSADLTVESIRASVSLHFIGPSIGAYTIAPDHDSLAAAVADLTERRARNRLEKAERAVAALQAIEQVLTENLEREWGSPGVPTDRVEALYDMVARGLRRPTAANHASYRLTQTLNKVLRFDATWRRASDRRSFGHDPAALWRTPGDSSGSDVRRDLLRAEGVREWLDDARRLLRRRLSVTGTSDVADGVTAIRHRARRCEGPDCGRIFQPQRSDSRYCTNACRQRAYRHRKAKP